MYNYLSKIYFAAFLTGLTALLYEIAASRALFYFFGDSTYSIATVIGIFLLGLAFGSFLFSRLEQKIEQNKAFFFLASEWAIALYALVVLPRFDFIPTLLRWIYKLGDEEILVLSTKFVISGLYLLFPAIILGMLLPFLLRLAVTSLPTAGRELGRVYFFDLLGAVAGTLVAGFFLVPNVGLQGTFFLGAVLNVICGPLFYPFSRKRWLLTGVGVVAIIFIVLFTNWSLSDRGLPAWPKEGSEMRSPIYNAAGVATLFYEPSPYGEIRIEEAGSNKIRTLFINRRTQCDTSGWKDKNLGEELFMARALDMLNRSKLKVLVIGLGCGFTATQAGNDSRVAEIDIVEINPVIIRASEYFREFNSNILHNPKVNLILEEGMAYLNQTDKYYDLIAVSVDFPLGIDAASSQPLYSQEFFTLAKNHLLPNGAFAILAYNHTDRYLAVIYQTLKTVFPSIFLYNSGVYDYRYFITLPKIFTKESIPPMSAKEQGLFERVKGITHVEINTLNNPSLLREK